MQLFEIGRSLRMLAAGAALALAACGGGGGGSGPAGPGGGGNDGGDSGLEGDYQLARVGFVELPADLTFEAGCSPVRVTGGALRLNDDGTWEFALAVWYGTAADEFDDAGTFQLNGTTLSFESTAYGDSFTGKIDGGIRLDYDYCPDGKSDIQLVFGR
jgi:hypothetical protein